MCICAYPMSLTSATSILIRKISVILQGVICESRISNSFVRFAPRFIFKSVKISVLIVKIIKGKIKVELSKDIDPLKITLEKAKELIEKKTPKKKAPAKRKTAAKKKTTKK